MSGQRDWVAIWTGVTAVLAWGLANALDIFSALIMVQLGARMALARHRPAEAFLIYAGLRVLGSAAFYLLAASVSRRWPATSRLVWGVLTVCALVTAIVAWLRLVR